MTNTSKNKVVIIGAGFIAATHLTALQAVGCQIAAIVDRNTAAAEKLAAACRQKPVICTDYRELPAELEYEAVHICVAPATHYDIATYFLNRGKALVLEKPLTLVPEEALNLQKTAVARQLPILICYNNRYYAANRQISTALQAKKWGEVLLLYGTYEQNFHLPPTPYSWRFAPEKGNYERAVSEIASHLIDLVQYWTGDKVNKVSARFIKRRQVLYRSPQGILLDQPTPTTVPLNIGNEDIAQINLQLASSALVNLLVSEVSSGQINSLNLTAICSAGRVHWSNLNSACIDESGSKEIDSSLTIGMQEGMKDSYLAMFQKFYPLSPQPKLTTEQLNALNGAVENVLICRKAYESNIADGAYLDL